MQTTLFPQDQCRKIASFYLCLLILSAVAIRGADLATHFTHVDDNGVAETILEAQKTPGTGHPVLDCVQRLTAVSHRWNYAPFQFLITYFLVHDGEGYRSLLFMGRLPSFLFALLGLGALLAFYRKYDRLKTPAFLLSFTVLALSWENIIYAKQMSNYSAGVFSAVGVLWLLLTLLKPKSPTMKEVFLAVFGLAFLSHVHYQVIFFAPAFFLAAFIPHWLRHRGDRRPLVGKIFAGVVAYALLIAPLYLEFLKVRNSSAGINSWNTGPHGEFLFSLAGSADFLAKVTSALIFFLKNFYIVFSVETASIPEKSIFFLPLSFLWMALFAFGIVRFVQTPSWRKKAIGLFFLGVAATWSWLVMTQKMTLSPTRHNLILLPFFCVVIGEGWNQLCHWGKKWRLSQGLMRGALAGVLTAAGLLFLVYAPAIVAFRHDPFNEKEIRETLEKYKVDTILTSGWTKNIQWMPGLTEQYNYYAEEFMERGYRFSGKSPYQTVAYISHRTRLSPAIFHMLARRISYLHVIMLQQPQFAMPYELSDYHLVYRHEILSDTEIDFSDRTKNGSNNLFFYVLERSGEQTAVTS